MDDLTAMLQEAEARKAQNRVDLTSGNFIPAQETNRIPNTPIDLTTANSTPKQPKGVPVHGGQISPNAVEFDPTTLIPKKEKVDEGANSLFGALDTAIERTKEEITESHKQLEAAMYEEFLNAEEEKEEEESKASTPIAVSVDNEPADSADEYYGHAATPREVNILQDEAAEAPKEIQESTPVVNTQKLHRSVTPIDTYEEKEEEDETDSSESTEVEDQEGEAKEIIEGLKSATKNVIRPKMQTIDLSKFSVSDRGIKASTIVVSSENKAEIADWVLDTLGCPISVRGLTGPELIKMDPSNSTRNRRNTLQDIYRIIYDHVVDSKKPSFENWLRQIPYSDVDHIYFALYKATFAGSNYISYQCPDCKKIFLKEANFDDMVKYTNDEAKERVKNILAMDTNIGEAKYPIDRIQVSNTFVFDMKTPSLYNALMEISGLPDNIMDKYSTLVDIISYIDAIYTIDMANMTLVPVMIPVVKDDPVKSAIKRVKTIADILKNLTSDEYQIVSGYAAKAISKASEITYITPAVKCPDCDKEIPANENVSGQDLLFTRHQLGAFANM